MNTLTNKDTNLKFEEKMLRDSDKNKIVHYMYLDVINKLPQ